jgi:flagellin-like hook-associated protein FlgL
VGTGGFVITGAAAGDRSGHSVSGAGDVNGDGLADLIVGAKNGNPGGAKAAAGESTVVFGKADSTAVELSNVGHYGFVINGNAAGSNTLSGYSVSDAGDVNGDGFADLIVGAYGANFNRGESTVVFGKADSTTVELSAIVSGAIQSRKLPVLVTSGVAAKASIGRVDAAIKTVNTQRAELGAVSNRLGHTVNNLTSISTNLSSARGGIEDADFALETTNLAKNQMLQQASTAMLAQANASKQNVLSLLQ